MADLQTEFRARIERTAMLPCYAAKDRYYLPKRNGNLFAVRLTGEADHFRMICGIVCGPSPRDLQFVREYGVPDCLCAARIGHPLLCKNDIDLAADAAYDFYFAASSAGSAEIRQALLHRRQTFVRRLNAAFRKFGFCKRGNDWIGSPQNGIFPVWNITFTRDDHFSLCFARTHENCRYLTSGEKTDFDWQILAPFELDAIIGQAVAVTKEEIQKRRCE